MQLPRLKSSDWNSLTGVLSPFQTVLVCQKNIFSMCQVMKGTGKH